MNGCGYLCRNSDIVETLEDAEIDMKWKMKPAFGKWRPTEQLEWKSVRNNFISFFFFFLSMKIWTNIFSAPEEFKRIKTHLLIYHSQRTQLSSWQVSLTYFTHLEPVCKLRLSVSQVAPDVHNHETWERPTVRYYIYIYIYRSKRKNLL